jgi:hypothetical protein
MKQKQSINFGVHPFFLKKYPKNKTVMRKNEERQWDIVQKDLAHVMQGLYRL